MGKLLKTTYHRRSMYRYTEARIELVKNSKSIRSKLSVWPGTEYTWALIWKKSLLIYFESYQGIPYLFAYMQIRQEFEHFANS